MSNYTGYNMPPGCSNVDIPGFDCDDLDDYCVECGEVCVCGELTIIDGLRIRTEFLYPPIPDRAYDWAAWIDGEEENNIVGRGRTESEAVAELLTTLDERDDLAEASHA